MEFKIIKKEKNALFNREDVTFTATNTGATPTRLEVRDLLAAKTGAKAETIVIINISSEFGKNTARGTAHIYKSKKELERKEPKYIVKRLLPKEKKKKPAPVEEKEEEKPEGESKTEEKEEEKPAEEKVKEAKE